MSSLNKVMLIGNVGTDPEKKMTNTGRSVTTLSVATNEYFTDSSGTKQQKTTWHRVTFWNQLADNITKYVKKGSLIYIEGRLQNSEYTDNNGQKRYVTDIVANQAQFLDSLPNRNQNTNQFQQQSQQDQMMGTPSAPPSSPSFNQPQQAPPMNQNQPKGFDDFMEDDIPF